MNKQKNIPELRFSEFVNNGGWVKKKLVDISIKIQDGTHFSPKSFDTGDFLYITSKNVKDGSIELSTAQFISKEEHENIYKRCDVKQGDVLLTKDGTIGQSCVNELTIPFSLLSSVVFIRLKTNFSNYFLYHLLVSQIGQKEIESQIAGQALKRITLTKINNFSFDFPSLQEQQKIASFLTSIDDKLQALKKKKSLLEQYKKGVMQSIFSQQLRFTDEDGREFPKWESKKLGEVAKFRRGSFPQPYGLGKWYDEINGTPFVQVFDVDDNFKLKASTKSKISDEAKPFSVFVEKGTVVLTIQGSIGRIALTQYDAYVDRTLLIFESYKFQIDKYFFMYLVYLLFQIEKEKAPGGIIKTITKEVLSHFSIILPSINEQIKIANFLIVLDEKINLSQTQIEKTEQYKKGLLQKMFC